MNFTANHFQLFDLPVCYQLDMTRLDEAYRKLQNEVHPDRFAAAGEGEKRLSMQWATRVNEAYQTLKKPLSRAAYLLELNGMQAITEKHTALPPAFLMQQMEWREAIGQARQRRDHAVLVKLADELRVEQKHLEQLLGTQLDGTKDYEAAGETVRKLKFMHKLIEEIGDAQEKIEAA